ncbi:hypothetical protein P7K49_033988 [Saguinus oedipus]|uniref:Uncharacterized protein n=1 Tax=Saguinus oedipus TaxID=9490 RepID=A0ABQ9TTG6_SAGOE|nr:hypothetical protein P7K49_033988 [Saguinus oedipus]
MVVFKILLGSHRIVRFSGAESLSLVGGIWTVPSTEHVGPVKAGNWASSAMDFTKSQLS